MRPTGFQGAWREDADARAVYAESASIHRLTPRAVAVPVDAADVQALVRWAGASRTAVVARGSGSSMTGACLGEGVIVDLSALRTAPRIDAARQTASCAPGTTRAALDRAARDHGLRFPIDPSSGAFCTMGGMVATNAAGARSLKFGAMRQWVTGLDCVFADGTRAWVRRGHQLDMGTPILARFAAASTDLMKRSRQIPVHAVRKNSSGYALPEFAVSGELIDLLVGSEGTLAIFLAIEVALCPMPAATAVLLASFPTLEGAVMGAGLAREAGASACELLDRTFLRIATTRGGDALPIDASAEAALLIELESLPRASGSEAGATAGSESRLAAQASALEAALCRAGASLVMVGLEPESEESLWALRHAASPILARLDPAIASMQVIEDGVVPPGRLSEYVHGVRQALDRSECRGVIFGHAGDANVHVNALVDVRVAGWKDRLGALYAEVTELTARLGGTASGEHGDGRLRTPMLDRFWPPAALALFADIKTIFDAAERLNPGVKCWRPNVAPWGEVKYDVSLPAPTRRAQQVLERVSKERAYDRSRLEMLDETV